MKRIFEFMDIKLSLYCENVQILEYCTNYFEDYFKCTVGQHDDVNVAVYVSEEEYVDKHFSLETEHPFKIYINKEEKKIILMGIKTSDSKAVVRIIRELFLYYISDSQKSCFLHAACVANEKVAIAITGDKFAGKTTMCLNFLQAGWNFISNDKLILTQNCEQKFICWGLPIALGVREGTINLFAKELKHLQRDSEDSRYYLSPRDLVSRFGCEITNGKPLKIILVPVYAPDAPTLTLTKLTKAESAEILRAQYLSSLYSDHRKIKSLCVQPSVNFIDNLTDVSVYRVVVNKELNYQLESAINMILMQGE